MRKLSLGLSQPQMMASSFNLQGKEVEGLFFLCSENKGADQLYGNGTGDHRTADLRLFFACAKSRYSHDVAHLSVGYFAT